MDSRTAVEHFGERSGTGSGNNWKVNTKGELCQFERIVLGSSGLDSFVLLAVTSR